MSEPQTHFEVVIVCLDREDAERIREDIEPYASEIREVAE